MKKTGLLLTAWAFLAINSGASADVSDGAVKIAVMSDFTGIYSREAGQGSVVAAELAVEDMGGEVLGQPIELIEVDHGLDKEKALKEAARLRDEGVDAFADIVGSQIAVAIQKFADEHKIIALQSASATGTLTDKACSKYGFHWTYDTHALSAGTANAMMDRGSEDWYFVAVDYILGDILTRDARNVVEERGGNVLGVNKHPFKAKTVTPQLLEAQSTNSDVIAIANAGGDLVTAIRQAYELGLANTEDRNLVALLAVINTVRDVGVYASKGLIFTTGFYWNRDEATRRWSERFMRRHGGVPTMLQAGAYSSVLHYLKAVEAAGTDDSDKVAEQMRAMEPNDMFARNARIRADGRMVHDMYLVQVKSPHDVETRGDYLRVLDVLPGDKAFRPLSESQCPLVTGQAGSS